jgi:Uma2 family endonuclease
MNAAKSQVKFTYEDYRTLPESMAERYELLDGELVMVPSPTVGHQRASRNLETLLWGFVRERRLGEVLYAPCDVVLGEGKDRQVVQPDLFFVSSQRRHIVMEGEIRGAPDLVVEILSPATAERDRGYKRTLYARHGVQEYWLVDPDARTIEVFVPGEEGLVCQHVYRDPETLTSTLIEGLRLGLDQVFTP